MSNQDLTLQDDGIESDRATVAALRASREEAPGARLEHWFNDNGMSLRFLRQLDEQSKAAFVIILARHGDVLDTLAVPSAAHSDLQNVFILGGSFIGVAAKHMEGDLDRLSVVDSSFAALRESLRLMGDSDIRTPPASSKWEAKRL